MDREANPAPVEHEVGVEAQPWALPDPEPWRREIRDRVVALAWPLIVRPLVAHGADRRAYLPAEVEQRIRPVAEHLACAVVPSADQELFLRAFDLDWSTWTPRWDISAVWKPTPRSRPGAPISPRSRQRAIEQCFVHVLTWVLRSAFDYQSADDLALGMPRRLERHPLELRNGAQWWARHLAARREPHHRTCRKLKDVAIERQGA